MNKRKKTDICTNTECPPLINSYISSRSNMMKNLLNFGRNNLVDRDLKGNESVVKPKIKEGRNGYYVYEPTNFSELEGKTYDGEEYSTLKYQPKGYQTNPLGNININNKLLYKRTKEKGGIYRKTYVVPESLRYNDYNYNVPCHEDKRIPRLYTIERTIIDTRND